MLFTYVGTLGESALVPTDNKFYLAPNVALIRFNKPFIPLFFRQYMSTSDFYFHIIIPFSGSSSQPALSMQSIRLFPIKYPKINEQNQIGQLLFILENAINLQQRQIDNYKKLKQGLLQKLFPVDGEKVPVLRFADFHDNWEQCKLGNYSKIITGGTPNTKRSEYWNPKEIPWTSSGEVNNKIINKTNNMISKLGFENSSAKWIKKNSILIALAGQGKTRGTVAINNINLTTNQSIASISTSSNLNYKFIFQNLNKRYNELRQISSGNGTRGGLNKKIISDIYVPYICLNEQEKIGNILNRMDSIITLQQDKLDYLQRLKSSFLQNLFI